MGPRQPFGVSGEGRDDPCSPAGCPPKGKGRSVTSSVTHYSTMSACCQTYKGEGDTRHTSPPHLHPPLGRKRGQCSWGCRTGCSGIAGALGLGLTVSAVVASFFPLGVATCGSLGVLLPAVDFGLERRPLLPGAYPTQPLPMSSPAARKPPPRSPRSLAARPLG